MASCLKQASVFRYREPDTGLNGAVIIIIKIQDAINPKECESVVTVCVCVCVSGTEGEEAGRLLSLVHQQHERESECVIPFKLIHFWSPEWSTYEALGPSLKMLPPAQTRPRHTSPAVLLPLLNLRGIFQGRERRDRDPPK